jgi:polyisoprenoid-binding protein YceI
MTSIKQIAAASALSLTLAGSVFALAGWTSTESMTSESLITTASSSEAKLYDVDNSHSSVNFKIVHGQLANFYGRFNDFKGTISLDESEMTNSSIEFEVTISSIDTNNRTRDGHLKDADFFNSRQFRKATFSSSAITETEKGVYEVTGDLTLRGVTNTITATMTDLKSGSFQGADKIGFEVNFSLKRGDYEINKYLAPGGGEGGPLSNTVDLLIAIEAAAQ